MLNLRPTVEQVAAYVGSYEFDSDPDFEEVTFKNRGESRSFKASDLSTLREFLVEGEFLEYRRMMVKMPGRKTASKAEIRYEDNALMLVKGQRVVLTIDCGRI